jgi:phosphate transport system substrate-binding protein
MSDSGGGAVTDADRSPPGLRTRRRLLTAAPALIAMPLLAGLPRRALAHGPLRVSGTGSATGGMALLAARFGALPDGHEVIIPPAYGSSGGISAVVEGLLEVAVANRPPSPQEVARATVARPLPAGAPARPRGKGPLVAVEYARTPFVVAVHRDLGVSTLTDAQFTALYAPGRAVFPNGQRSRPVLRELEDIDTQLVGLLVPAAGAALRQAHQRSGMLRAATDTDAVDLIEKVPGAFGGSTLAQLLSERRPLQALTIGGREPTLDALVAGRYPLHKPLFLVTRAEPTIDARRFVNFVLSEVGQDLLEAHGHLPRRRFGR